MGQKKAILKESIQNILYMLRLLQQYKHQVIPVFLFMTVFQGIYPLLLVSLPKYSIDYITKSHSIDELLMFFTVAASFLFLVRFISTALKNRYNLYISTARTGCFESMLILKTFSMRYAALEDPAIQDLLSKARQVSWSQNSGAEGALRELGVIFANLITMIGYIVIIANLNPLLPAILTLLVGINWLLYKKARNYEYSLRNENANIERRMEYLDDTMSLIDCGKDIRLFGLSGFLSSKFTFLFQKRKATLKKEKYHILFTDVFSALLSALRECLVYGFLVYSYWKGMLDIGDFLLYFGALIGFSTVLVQIAGSISKIGLNAKCISDFKAIMELPEETQDAAVEMDMPQTVEILFDHISFHYAGSTRMILEDLCLEIKQGERVAVVGENGAGKSTLIKMLIGLYDPINGRILINGKDAKEYSKGMRYQMCSAVFQDIYQYAFTLEENITFSEPEQVQREHLKRCMNQSGLDDFVSSLPDGTATMLRKDFDISGIELSGGLEQKMALARALYKNTPLLILDEPTAALDPLAEQALYEKLDSLSNGKTAIYISHRLSSTQFCDKIAFLQNGRMVEYGSHQELMKKGGYYAEMFQVQSMYYRDEGNKAGMEEGQNNG